MSSTKCKLTLPFKTIDVAFRMDDRDIVWLPVFSNLITKPDADQTTLLAPNLAYETATDNNNDYYDADHGSVSFLSKTSLRAASKIKTFNCNSTFRWGFQRSHRQKDRVIYLIYTRNWWLAQWALRMLVENDKSRVPNKRINKLETKQASKNQNMVNIFGKLQRKLSALQTVATTSLNMQIDNEQSGKVSSRKHFLSYKLTTLLSSGHCPDTWASAKISARQSCNTTTWISGCLEHSRHLRISVRTL